MPSSLRSLAKSKSSSSTRSTTSSNSSRSTASRNTHSTATTAYSIETRPVIKHYDSCPPRYEDSTAYNVFTSDEGFDARSSTETYASTVASQDDLADEPEYELPDERHRIFESEAKPTSPPEFGKLFPTTNRILIQHDDSTSDGNMNLRLDTEAYSANGDKLKKTLFHLRMKNLHERQFSLRRYCRDSGREVCSSKKNRRSRDSGYESDDAEDRELEEELRNFTLTSEVKATIPTNIIRLEYSNYAQVEIHKRREGGTKKWDFEYWGSPYSWQREQQIDDGEIIYFYELINMITGDCVAYIMPDKLDDVQTGIEKTQGGWVPPCSMRLTEKVTDDLGDVIVATGLIAMTDDCIKRRWHSSRSARVLVPNESAPDFVAPEKIVDLVFPRKGAKAGKR